MLNTSKSKTKINCNIRLNYEKRDIHSNSFREIKQKINTGEHISTMENDYLLNCLNFVEEKISQEISLSNIILSSYDKLNHQIHIESLCAIMDELYNNCVLEKLDIVFLDDIGIYNDNGDLRSNYIQLYEDFLSGIVIKDDNSSTSSSSHDLDENFSESKSTTSSNTEDDIISPWYFGFGSFFMGAFIIVLILGIITWFKLKFNKIIPENKQEDEDQQSSILELFIYSNTLKIQLVLLLIPSCIIILYSFRYYYYYLIKIGILNLLKKDKIKVKSNLNNLQKIQHNTLKSFSTSKTKTILCNNIKLNIVLRHYPIPGAGVQGGKKIAEELGKKCVGLGCAIENKAGVIAPNLSLKNTSPTQPLSFMQPTSQNTVINENNNTTNNVAQTSKPTVDLTKAPKWISNGVAQQQSTPPSMIKKDLQDNNISQDAEVFKRIRDNASTPLVPKQHENTQSSLREDPSNNNDIPSQNEILLLAATSSPENIVEVLKTPFPSNIQSNPLIKKTILDYNQNMKSREENQNHMTQHVQTSKENVTPLLPLPDNKPLLLSPPAKPKILKNINGKDYEAFDPTKRAHNYTTNDVIQGLQDRELTKKESEKPPVIVMLENGSIHTFETNNNLKFTDTGNAYVAAYKHPSENTTLNTTNNVEIMPDNTSIIVPPKPGESIIVANGKSKHLLYGCYTNEGDFMATGYFTSKKSATKLSNKQYKTFENEQENNINNTQKEKAQHFVAFDNGTIIKKEDIKPVKYSEKYLNMLHKDILRFLKDKTQELVKKPCMDFDDTCGLTKEDAFYICKEYDINAEAKTKNPKAKSKHPISPEQQKFNENNSKQQKQNLQHNNEQNVTANVKNDT